MSSDLRKPIDPQDDCFKPPAIPTLVHCLHCGEEYESYLIYWEDGVDARGKPDGFWSCGIDDCDGRGFGFDIFPLDPDYIGEDGERMWNNDPDTADDDESESAEATWEDDATDWTPDDLMGEDDIPW